MIVYKLEERKIQIKWKNRMKIKEGISCHSPNYQIIKSFSSKNVAIEELKKFETNIWYNYDTGMICLTEYCIGEMEYEDDGPCMWWNGFVAWSNMSIDVVDYDTGEYITTCNNYADVFKVENNYKGNVHSRIYVG